MNQTNRDKIKQLSAWFLGPKAENAGLEEEMILHILRDYHHWRRNYYPSDESLITPKMRRETLDWTDQLSHQVSEMLALLKKHFPFYSPRYLGHQLSDQTMPSVLGYFAGMLYNPNNVTPEAAPVTVEWELEVGRDLLTMLGYKCPPRSDQPVRKAEREFGWAHITSGGTVANLEAMWVARNIRYFPLAVKYAAQNAGLAIDLELPNLSPGHLQRLSELDDRQCLGVKPNEAIALLARFVDAVRRHFDISSIEEAAQQAWELLQQSGLSIVHSGTRSCFDKFPPVIFVSGAAHYSIAKTADVLGIGRDQVVQVDVDSKFRMDIRDLDQKFKNALRRGMYPLGVIAIAGTTEEGAVDPIHDICDFRQRIEREAGCSFWLHIDAAWGGYLRSLFVPGDKRPDQQWLTLDQCIDAIDAFTSRTLDIRDGKYRAKLQTQWSNKDVCSAFLAFPHAESITVDPHKMGYIPYPCGVVAFRNDQIRHFLTQKAPYINSVTRATVHGKQHDSPTSVGPFILEGSKPGAAAAACWLSHRMIPPNMTGYGKIMRASLLGARELYERLIHWEQACRVNKLDTRYEFNVVTHQPPDTNIVCFTIKEKATRSLQRMNLLTQLVYEKFSIQTELGEHEYSYAQPFFLSRTILSTPRYSCQAVKPFLERVNIDSTAYPEHGIFVLRSTVMTPYIVLASESGRTQEYLADFVTTLARAVDESISQLHQETALDYHRNRKYA